MDRRLIPTANALPAAYRAILRTFVTASLKANCSPATPATKRPANLTTHFKSAIDVR